MTVYVHWYLITQQQFPLYKPLELKLSTNLVFQKWHLGNLNFAGWFALSRHVWVLENDNEGGCSRTELKWLCRLGWLPFFVMDTIVLLFCKYGAAFCLIFSCWIDYWLQVHVYSVPVIVTWYICAYLIILFIKSGQAISWQAGSLPPALHSQAQVVL